MSDDDAPKSAVELAMEKLRARSDYEESKLTDEQREKIAEIRSRFKAKIAELEIHHQSKLQGAGSYEELEALQAELKDEKAKLEQQMESKVEEVRKRD